MKAAVIRCFSIFDTQKARKIGHKREQKTTKEIKTLHRFKNLKSLGVKPVPVQVRLAAPKKALISQFCGLRAYFFAMKKADRFVTVCHFIIYSSSFFILKISLIIPDMTFGLFTTTTFISITSRNVIVYIIQRSKNRLLNMTAQQANIRF